MFFILRGVALAVSLALLTTRRRVVGAFQRANATTPARAMRWPFGARWPHSFWRGRLLDAGVIQQTADGQYWLDRAAFTRHRRAMRQRALGAVALVVLAGAVAFWWNARAPL